FRSDPGVAECRNDPGACGCLCCTGSQPRSFQGMLTATKDRQATIQVSRTTEGPRRGPRGPSSVAKERGALFGDGQRRFAGNARERCSRAPCVSAAGSLPCDAAMLRVATSHEFGLRVERLRLLYAPAPCASRIKAW